MSGLFYTQEPWIGFAARLGEPAIDPILFNDIEEFEMSVRLKNCLRSGNLSYLGDVVQETEGRILRLFNMGRLPLNELKEIMYPLNLTLGMDIPNWPKPGNVLRAEMDGYSATRRTERDALEAVTRTQALEAERRREAERTQRRREAQARLEIELAEKWPSLTPETRVRAERLRAKLLKDFAEAGIETGTSLQRKIKRIVLSEITPKP